MKYKNWSDLIWQNLKSALKEEKASVSGGPPIAAFDADGTLWHTDLGENFFRYQIAHSGLKDLPPDPWEHYSKWKSSGDPRPAYLWLAQINKGRKFSEVQAWAKQAVETLTPLPVFEEQRKWIEILLNEGVEVFVVTASVKWAVEPAAKRLGIDEKHVLGVETAVDNGVVTDRAHGFMTYREGKPSALLKVTGGRRPFFASGNTGGDTALLESATRVRLAVRTNPSIQSDELIASEGSLFKEATQKGWLTHEF